MNRNHPGWLILLLTGLLAIVASSANASPHHARPHAAIQGRWVAGPIPLNHGGVIGIYPWCRRFTHNLNQFRRLPFNTCSSRLSKKYPEFQHPHWTEIPWDRALAKKVFMVGPYPNSPGYERDWRGWLKDTQVLRRAGKVHLWHTSVDLLGNGQQETLIRLDHVSRSEVIRGGQVVGSLGPYCRHIDSKLYLLPSPDPALAQSFNTYSGGLFNDVLYDAKGKRYFFLEWEHNSTPGKFFRIATGSVAVSVFSGTPVCDINWIPERRTESATPLSHATQTHPKH